MLLSMEGSASLIMGLLVSFRLEPSGFAINCSELSCEGSASRHYHSRLQPEVCLVEGTWAPGEEPEPGAPQEPHFQRQLQLCLQEDFQHPGLPGSQTW